MPDMEEGEGPYGQASYISKLQKTGTMVLTDLDGTMTDGHETPTDRELADRGAVRELLEKQGVVAGAVTARTCGLTLSEEMYKISTELREAELPPLWGVDPKSGLHTYVDLAGVPYFRHCLDWDVTASFGSRIIVRNGHGYRVDHAYEYLLRYDYAQGRHNPEPWRHAMMMFFMDKCGALVRPHLSKIESRINYDRGIVNVAPLEFRYQLDFYGSQGLAAMQELKGIIDAEFAAGHPVALRIVAVDESRICEADSEKSRYTLYLIPWGARKEKMIHRLFSQSARAAQREPKDLKLFYAGDTLTDLRAGLWAGGDAAFKFVLPKGSRLAPYLIERKPEYGTESLAFLWEDPTKGRSKPRLVPTRRKGEYEFIHKIRGQRKNIVVIADERYPNEKTAPGSVAAFLEEYLVNSNGAGA